MVRVDAVERASWLADGRVHRADPVAAATVAFAVVEAVLGLSGSGQASGRQALLAGSNEKKPSLRAITKPPDARRPKLPTILPGRGTNLCSPLPGSKQCRDGA